MSEYCGICKQTDTHSSECWSRDAEIASLRSELAAEKEAREKAERHAEELYDENLAATRTFKTEIDATEARLAEAVGLLREAKSYLWGDPGRLEMRREIDAALARVEEGK